MTLQQIRQIKRFLRELFYFKKLIKRYGKSLLPGCYCLFPSLRAIAANQPETMEKAERYFAKNKTPGKLTKLVGTINAANFYCNRKQCQEEDYEAIYSANNYDKVREIKLFSFRRQEILTICTNAAACEKQLAEYGQWHKWFAMPAVERQTRYQHSYTIAMVDLQPRPAETAALENIAQSVSAYGKDNPAPAAIPATRLANLAYGDGMNRLLSRLTDAISAKAMSLTVPLCLQHGDLSRDNLLYGTCAGETGFWWIDWEHARQRLFFYDYFFYILNTAVYFSDATGLHAYLTGDCDSHLAVLFSQFGMDYDAACRKDYFLIFAISFLKERVCDRGNERALNMYIDFIEKTVLDETQVGQ